MSKYDKLWKHISLSAESPQVLTFEDIERIAGVPIDHSFLKYKKELTKFGWEVKKISMKEKKITFGRNG